MKDSFSLLLVSLPIRSTLIPDSVSRSRSVDTDFPWLRSFSPQTPPMVGHLSIVEHLCSSASSILLPHPTSRKLTCRAFGHRPSPTVPYVETPLVTSGISRFPCKKSVYMLRVYDLSGSDTILAISQYIVLPSPSVHKVGNPNR